MINAHKQVRDVDVVALQGELVMASCGPAKEQLCRVVNNGSGKLIIDLSGVPFMDSSGLAVLVSAFKAASGKQGQVALLRVTREVRSLIELTRLHQVFDIFDDETAAIAYLS